MSANANLDLSGIFSIGSPSLVALQAANATNGSGSSYLAINAANAFQSGVVVGYVTFYVSDIFTQRNIVCHVLSETLTAV